MKRCSVWLGQPVGAGIIYKEQEDAILLNLKCIYRLVGICAHLELRKEMGLEIEHSPNIHEVLAIFPALIIVFMEHLCRLVGG